jgi:hypothetical protein
LAAAHLAAMDGGTITPPARAAGERREFQKVGKTLAGADCRVAGQAR